MSPEPTPVPPQSHARAAKRLRRAALEGPGHTEPALRQGIAAHAAELWEGERSRIEIPPELVPYVDKVARSAYKVVDGDVEELRTVAYSEEQIFEITIAAAVGCGMRALEIGLAAARGEG